MSDFLLSVIYFLVALGILIAVHEFGHFWVARRVGVKVLRFCFGFGKPIWSVRVGPDQVEYAIAAIPFGGYVKMLDEREGPVPDNELHRAFNRQSIAKRAAVFAAGPLFNFAFAIAAYWLVYVIGITGVTPILGEVTPGSPADRAGLRQGQTIVAVGSEEVAIWDQVGDALLEGLVRKEPVELTVMEQGRTSEHRLPLDEVQQEVEPGTLFKLVGFRPLPVEPLVGRVVADSPAARAGMRAGDRISALEGKPIDDWVEFVSMVRESPNKPLQVVVERGAQRETLQVTPDAITEDDRVIGKIGAEVDAKVATGVLRYGPLAALGASAAKTFDMSVLTLRVLGKIVVGQASLQNISGPISIAQGAKQSAGAGGSRFLMFLAIVSLSLGVLNLLPVPVLDGGHLMFCVVEAIKGSPVSEKTEMVGQLIGLLLIVALMALAIYNDLARIVG